MDTRDVGVDVADERRFRLPEHDAIENDENDETTDSLQVLSSSSRSGFVRVDDDFDLIILFLNALTALPNILKTQNYLSQ